MWSKGMKTKLLVQMMGLSTPLLMAACSTHTPKWQEENEAYHKSVQDANDSRAQMTPKDISYVEFNSGYYVDKTPIQIIKNQKNLPSIFYKNIDMFSPNPISLRDLAGDVYKKAAVSIKFIDNRTVPTEDEAKKILKYYNFPVVRTAVACAERRGPRSRARG